MDRIDTAFIKVKRADFVPETLQAEAEFDVPVPIGFGQTNSQPTTVRLMMEWLQPEPGNTVLDVGSGSGWTTALLATIVGPRGRVFAVEKIPELVAFGRQNCRRIGITNVRFFPAGSTFGLPEHAPYDRILVSADAHELPDELTSQLARDGKMVIPVRGTILEVTKLPNKHLDIIPHSGFVFVPLVEELTRLCPAANDAYLATPEVLRPTHWRVDNKR